MATCEKCKHGVDGKAKAEGVLLCAAWTRWRHYGERTQYLYDTNETDENGDIVQVDLLEGWEWDAAVRYHGPKELMTGWANLSGGYLTTNGCLIVYPKDTCLLHEQKIFDEES